MLTIRTLTTSINRMALATVVAAGLIFAAGGEDYRRMRDRDPSKVNQDRR